MSFKNKVVIVTGGSSGIGAAAALQFAKESAKLAIVGRNEEKLESVAKSCEALGSSPLIIIADVSKPDEAKSIVEKTVNHYGSLDILVNNAGQVNSATFIQDENIMDVYDELMSTNFRSIVQITNQAVPHLIKTKGNIVNISSIAATSLIRGRLIYCSSKAALDQFSRCVALELAEYGIRVNVVSPGPVRTDIMINSGVDETTNTIIWNQLKETAPLKILTEPNEVADLIVYLASEKAKSLTGSVFKIDCGSTLSNNLGSQKL